MKKIDIRSKRIPVELRQIKNSTKNHGITCEPKSDTDFTTLEAIIPGPKNSPYENGKFKLNIELAEQYPFRPPMIKFITRMYHPNIDNVGKICLDVLQIPPNGSYCPALTLESILISIQLLLATPNPDDPLQSEIADLYKYHRDKFEQNAKNYTKKYAMEEQNEVEKEENKQFSENSSKKIKLEGNENNDPN